MIEHACTIYAHKHTQYMPHTDLILVSCFLLYFYLHRIIKITNSFIACFAAFNSIDLPYGLSRDTLQSVAEYAGALLDEFSSKESDNDYGIY